MEKVKTRHCGEPTRNSSQGNPLLFQAHLEDFPIHQSRDIGNSDVFEQMTIFLRSQDMWDCSTGEDGKVVLETIYAAYASAGLARRVDLPFQPTASSPIYEWLSRKERLSPGPA